MEKSRKIGPLLLSGLMIGPILGSGIIILPPLVYSVAGDWALIAWGLMIVTGFFFALVFGKLSMLHPGDAGVATVIEHAFGRRVKYLSCFYLFGAVLFGPVAVMLTAAHYLLPNSAVSHALVAVPLLLLCNGILLRPLNNIGIIALILSSISALTLFCGGVITLLFQRKEVVMLQDYSGGHFGYALLLLFWTIVGWEVVGSYSGEVKDPQKNIMRAVVFSAIVIGLVSLVVSGAVQMAAPMLYADKPLHVTAIITPLFGSGSENLMSILVLALCSVTYLLFVGSVARLVSSLAVAGVIPTVLSRKNLNGAPVYAVVLLTSVHLIVLLACHMGVMDVESLVALADGFFIANAFIGLVAAVKMLKDTVLRVVSAILCILFFIIFINSSSIMICVVLLLAGMFLFLPKHSKQRLTAKYNK